MHIGARHAAMRDVADDCDAQPFELGRAIQNCEGIEQRLSGMFMRAISCIDDGIGRWRDRKCGAPEADGA